MLFKLIFEQYADPMSHFLDLRIFLVEGLSKSSVIIHDSSESDPSASSDSTGLVDVAIWTDALIDLVVFLLQSVDL